MSWTQRLSVAAQQRQAGTFNTGNFNIPAVVGEMQVDLNFPNQLPNDAIGTLRVQFSLDNAKTWLPQQQFSWELTDRIGTIDKNGNLVTENPIISFVIGVPDSAKSAKMRASITLDTPQFIGLTVYTQ